MNTLFETDVLRFVNTKYGKVRIEIYEDSTMSVRAGHDKYAYGIELPKKDGKFCQLAFGTGFDSIESAMESAVRFISAAEPIPASLKI